MDALVHLAAEALIVWRTAHIGNNGPMVESFGDIGVSSRRVFTIEWIAEGLTHIAVGLLAALVALEGSSTGTGRLVDRGLAGVLIVLAALTASFAPLV
jgi:hypothetical protein